METKKNRFFKISFVLFLTMFCFLMASCKTITDRASSKKASRSSYLASIGKGFSETIFTFMQTLEPELQKSSLLALLSTKNDTVDDIPVEFLDSVLVKELLSKRIYTVRTEDRGLALQELQFQLAGFADGRLKAGEMKSPDYFIKIKIDENRYLASKKKRIIERSFFMELRSVQTQLVVASSIETEVIEQKLTR